MFLRAGKASSKCQKHSLAPRAPAVVEAVIEAEFMPCEDEPSSTNKPLNGSFDDLDIPYIDEEEDEDAIATQ